MFVSYLVVHSETEIAWYVGQGKVGGTLRFDWWWKGIREYPDTA